MEMFWTGSSMNKNRRILIIDDNPAIHEDFRNILLPRREHAKKLESIAAAIMDEVLAKLAPIFE